MPKESITPNCASVENCLACTKECPIGPVVVLPGKKIVAKEGVILKTGPSTDADIFPLEANVVLEVESVKYDHYVVKMTEAAKGKKIEGVLFLTTTPG